MLVTYKNILFLYRQNFKYISVV